ncbi:epithelial membrane protein 1, partial [Biomphalaria glabrata]
FEFYISCSMALPNGLTALHCAGTAVIGVGVLLQIVALATPNWTYGKYYKYFGDSKVKAGLWKFCVETFKCQDIPEEILTDEWNTAGAFAILGMLAGLMALSLTCIHFVLRIMAKPTNKIVNVVVLAACIAACLCVVISTSCFGGGVYKQEDFDKEGQKIGYSLILSVVGGYLIGLGGVLFFVACVKYS